MNTANITAAYELARERYAAVGVDVVQALETLSRVAISLHCWQGDDVVGFEGTDAELGSGLAVTGNYPGRARTADELRKDLDFAYGLIPGRHRLNLHALYGEFSQRVDRDEIGIEHFQGWIDWAKERQIGVDFNPSYFAHEKAADGFTLTHADPAVRRFWIDHGIACRQIASEIGRQLASTCINNVWIPDGMKDLPADRLSPRNRLIESLDELFLQSLDPAYIKDSVECKLFGIGSESYVVGSHEFYLGYAITRQKILCLDAGHFHPTEVISDKITSTLQFVPELLLHVSRGVRWDSDHVVTFTDELQAIMQEIVRNQLLNRVHIGLDYFDASINRVAAWVIGTRNALKSLLMALLEPTEQLRRSELEGDWTARLAIMEEQKSMPMGAVWDYYCLQQDVPVGIAWIDDVRQYEREEFSKRDTMSCHT
ncbi:MAG: L-rhamnose isomerase [Planctomycetales bacterium]|nr:L-rhamnose isomerase [Planctomycetales bacterium]